ncbi:MAG TPA: type II toxin-antitoxin system RelE/ParE family toxin [Candidatus Nanoarchaeia archaeon]|nr:type II toxin-antitoxin system RelE/ParE family toxin [Candidatus Nanoarchaeia archaeon]
MVEVIFYPHFHNIFSKIKERSLKERIIKQLTKIRENPEIGKSMMNARKGTREVYIPPFRLSYAYNKEQNMVIILDLYHKDEQ